MIILAIITPVFYFQTKYKWVAGLIVALAIVLAIIALQTPFFASVRTRLEKALLGEDWSTIERLTLAKEAGLMFLSKPFFGWGYNGIRAYSTQHLFAHNNFLGLLADFGLFGFLCFESMLILPMIRSRKKLKSGNGLQHVKDGLFLLLLAVFLIQFFYVNYQLKFEFVFMGLASVLTPLVPDDRYYI